VQKGVVLHL